MIFDRAFELVVGLEGGYSNDPQDPGNWTGGSPGSGDLKGTKFGISAKAYPTLDIASLTLNEAKNIYMQDYWSPCRCTQLPHGVDFAVFDCAVNQGVGTAVRLLQKALRVTVDGQLGPKTLAAALAADPKDLLKRFLTKRAKRYMLLGNFDRYGDGWLNRLFDVAMISQEK